MNAEQSAAVLTALKAWGRHATSFQILEEGYDYWFDTETPAPGAVIAYRVCGKYRVVAGVPISPAETQGEVAARFIQDGRKHGLNTLFFSADQAFVDTLKALEGAPPVDSVAIGEQPEWSPERYTSEGPERASLRAQLHRARNKGVKVRTVSEQEVNETPGPLRAEIEGVLERWLRSRRMSAMAFLVDLQPFHYASERRYYIAEHEGRAVAFLSAIPIYQSEGWVFEDVLRVPDAPNGSIELLIDTAMKDAATRGDQFVTLGLSPLAQVDTLPGPHRLLRRVFRWSYDHLGALYSFEGIRHFKARFKPDRWRTQLLVSSPEPLNLGAIRAVLQAFAGGGLTSFAFHSLRRWYAQLPPARWAAALWLLAGLLVPWTLLLASADGERWFGDVSIQSAWVAFDSLMVVALSSLGALVRLGKRAARPFALLLAGATGADFLLTTAQALNLHQSVQGAELLFVVAGASGPLIATLLLIALADALTSGS